MEDSWEHTRAVLLWTQEHLTPTEIQQNAPNYSFIWGAHLEQADQFRAANPQMAVGFYLPSLLDDQAGRPIDLLPDEDSPDRRLQTLLWWILEVDGVGHPDWILYRCDGVTPAYERMPGPPFSIPNIPLDITNPAVIDWQVRERDGMQAGFTNFSTDFVLLHNWNRACGVYRNGEWVQLFNGEEDDPAYPAAVLNWASEIRRRLSSQRYPKGVVVNFPLDAYYSYERVASLAANVDGILDEEGFTYFGEGRDVVSWLQLVQKMILIQNQGAAIYSVNYVQSFPPTPDEVNWIYGSFLMAREHTAYIAITDEMFGPGYMHWSHLPEFDQDLGHPCGEMIASQGVYVRDFSKGMVMVNPSHSSSYTFSLPPESFADLYGTPVEQEIVLEPLTGKILVSDGPRCP